MLARNSNAAHPLTARALRLLLKVFPAPGGGPQHARQLVDDIQPMSAIDLQTVENRHEIGRDTSALVVAHLATGPIEQLQIVDEPQGKKASIGST